MALPPRRVLAFAISADPSPIEDSLDPAADPAGRLGLHGPNRFDRLHDEAGVDSLHRQVAEDRVHVPA